MQKSVFSHFGADFQTAGAADLGAADFTTAKNSGKMELLQGSAQNKAGSVAQGKATNSVFSGLRALSLSLSLSLSLVACLGLFSPVLAEDLTQDTYTSGYNYGGGEFINKNGHTITLIGGGTSADKPGATFNDKVTNQAGATITTINGWANFKLTLKTTAKSAPSAAMQALTDLTTSQAPSKA